MTDVALNPSSLAGDRPRLRPSMRQFVTLLLLIVGVQCWLVVIAGRVERDSAESAWGERRQLWALLATAILSIGLLVLEPTRNALVAAADRLANPSAKARRITALLLALLSALYLYHTATSQQGQVGPVIHDEYCYQLQARMIASGHLWMPHHELADFFDSFHLLTDHVYAVKYSPGTALLYAPAAAVGMPGWVTPLLLSAASVALLYLVLTQFIDGLAGLLGAIMLLAVPVFRRVAMQTLSQAPMLFLVLLALWAFLNWRRARSPRWMALIAAAIGLGAITRPVDAVAMAAPLALAILWDLRRASRQQWLTTIAVAFAALAPFLLLQLVYDRGLTGQFTKLPWAYYSAHNDPYDTIRPNAAAIAKFDEWPDQPQKAKFLKTFSAVQYRLFLASGAVRRLLNERLAPAFEDSLPNPLLIILAPIGLIALSINRRWVAVAFLLGFFGVYAFYPFFLDHYAVVALPAIFLLVLAGGDRLTRALGSTATPLRIAGALCIIALTLTALPQLRRNPDPDMWATAATMRAYDAALKPLAGKPSIVLFHFDPEKSDVHCEPVYNITTAWPDDARVIRAHDLGPRNVELYRYYAARAPDRAIYRYDRGKDGQPDALEYLGTARDLAQHPNP